MLRVSSAILVIYWCEWLIRYNYVIATGYSEVQVFRNLSSSIPSTIKRRAIALSSLLLTNQYSRMFLHTCLIVCASIAAVECHSQLAAILHAVCCCVLSHFLYSITGFHNTFTALYLNVVLILPSGWVRGIVILTVVVHSYLSPGLIKLFVGGREWISSGTLKATLVAYEPRAKCRPLSNLLRRSKSVCVMINISTLVLECVIVPLLFVVETYCASQLLSPLENDGGGGGGDNNGGGGECGVVARQYKIFVMASICAFHCGIYCCTGLQFTDQMVSVVFGIMIGSHDLSVVAAASSSSDLTEYLFAFVMLISLFVSVWYQLDSWPLNGLAIFPFNVKQILLLQNIDKQIRFVVVPDQFQSSLRVGHVVKDFNAEAHDLFRLSSSLEINVATVFNPEFFKALGLGEQHHAEKLTDSKCSPEFVRQTIGNLRHWLVRDQPYCSSVTGKSLTCVVAMDREYKVVCV